MKRATTVVVLVAILGGTGWQVYRKLRAGEGVGQKRGVAAVAVEVAAVSRATVRDVAHFSGDLMARSEFVVAPKVAGRLVKLLVDIGDTLANDQLIAVLDDDEYNQQVEQAKAELEVSRASVDEATGVLEAAQREYDRVQALRGKKIASESELDEARSQYRTALARQKLALSQVAQKDAALKTAEVRQSYTKIRASWSGGSEVRIVGERFADAGAMLKANDPIVSVVEIDELTAVIHVTEGRYGKVQVGQTADVSCYAYQGKSFAGKVVRVAPLVKQTSRQARVEVQVDNAERLLRPGMSILARIELARHEGATVVPAEAIVGRDGDFAVFLVDGKKARRVPVSVGLREGSRVEIVEPPLDGTVITLGQHLLEDGTLITVSSREELAGAPAATQPAGARVFESGAEAKS